MLNYKRITTSAEVWVVIRAKHAEELVVFSTLSEPDGDPFGNQDHCRMMTEYGFRWADIPVIGAETTWKKHPKDNGRVNEKTTYWLCVANSNYDED